MYELTTVLTTIAACSASIVAILGGLIASKLIALNTERDEVKARITELNEEIDFFTQECDMLQEQLDEDDALDFIEENVQCLIQKEKFSNIYKEENRPQLPRDVLQVYWSRAEKVNEILTSFFHDENNHDCKWNEDGVPVKIAKIITQNFEYSVCEKICDYLYQQTCFSNTRYYLNSNVSHGNWYANTQEKRISVDNKISYLTLQKKQLITRRKALEKSKGMKAGLLLFAIFSFLNIVLPLCLVPFLTDNYYFFLIVKISFILTFFVGLIAIMCYLVYLLHWN